ncbi:SDR family NAD(P)-dependent oxidoreductase [Bradyrhizobium tropiciagri]|uniref:SDR family NAD(P)-dependent oxidoreductase n=1 Tax=Bradyrhizobium tropiciagri TaxID=312253 RepID=UPI00067E4FD2|nr:SDR family NAD(P)-dependent oxidoreductase [Bradyrhizobium tropiciagri]
MSKPVCIVTGVGPEYGTGAEIAKRFSEGGYQVAMLARNADNLDALARKYRDARAYPCDVGDLDALIKTVTRIKAEMGAPKIVVHNALRATRGSILEMDPNDLERNFRVNTTALLHLARETIPAMLEAGEGAILVTGNTSAIRGKTNWGFFASTKAAQRILAESMAREFGPRGIHVAYILIDASIDTPRTRPLLAPDKPDDFFAKPAAIAEEMFRVAHQDRSTWSFLVELRPFGEVW